MVNIDMWYGNKATEADRIDVFFNGSTGDYRGNIYKDGKAIGDYSATDSAELENTFTQLTFNWD